MSIVTQSELKAAVTAQEQIRETEEAIMRRMVNGAEVEAGELVARTDARPGEDISLAGLEIETAAFAAEIAALVAQGAAAPALQ